MSYRDSQRFRKVYGYYRPLPRATDTSILAYKEYTDEVVAGIDWKQSVRAASTENIDLTSTVGGLDGISFADEDRVLVKDQTNAAENGIYIYYVATGKLTRTLDATQDTLTSGAAVYVEEGTENNGTAWILSTPDPITVDSTNQTWVLFSTIYPVFVKSGSFARSTSNVSFGNEYTDEIGSNVFFYVSGTIGPTATPKVSVFGGDVFASGSFTVKQGLSGSLTKLADGTSYLIAGTNIEITSASNGAVTISSTASGGGGDPNASYLVFSATGSLSNEFVITPSTGLTGSGTGGLYTLSIDNSVVATVSGTTFTGATKHNAGLSGSLTQLTDGTSYLIAGNNITISSASNGSITVTGLASGTSYFDSTTAGSIFTSGSVAIRGGESSVDSPADKGTNIFFYVSGSIGASGVNDKRAVLGGDTVISGALAQGKTTTASGIYSHAQGWNSVASGQYSHAEGTSTASGHYSHAEGIDTSASGFASHAEGDRSTSSGQYSHAEGLLTTATNDYSHAEGDQTSATGYGSHAEGSGTTAKGDYSHAQGQNTVAFANYSFTSGLSTIASGTYQAAIGQYNKRDNTASLLVIGNGSGSDNANRSDVLRVDPSGLQVTGSLGMKGNITPDEDRLYDLGAPAKRWANVYTGDLHLRNDRGDYTLIEEEDFLSIRFNKTGHRYKFVLERVPELDDKIE